MYKVILYFLTHVILGTMKNIPLKRYLNTIEDHEDY